MAELSLTPRYLDYRKDVQRLLTGWPYIPIEVAPIGMKTVLKALRELGCPNPELRTLGMEVVSTVIP